MVTAFTEQPRRERPDRVGPESPALPRLPDRDVDRGVAVIGLRFLAVLDVAGDLVVREDDECNMVVGVVEALDGPLEAHGPQPPCRDRRLREEPQQRRPVIRRERTKRDALAADLLGVGRCRQALAAPRAWSRSAMRSSTVSMPTDSRMTSGRRRRRRAARRSAGDASSTRGG